MKNNSPFFILVNICDHAQSYPHTLYSPVKAPLTPRQDETFEFIRQHIQTRRKPPTLKEIAAGLEISSLNAVHKLLSALERKGYLKRHPNVARGLELMSDADPFAIEESTPSLPVISRTPSSQPERLRSNASGFLLVDDYFLRNATNKENCLIGRAGDDGMNGDGIRKGDFLIIEEEPMAEVRNGALAAFLVRDSLVARRFHFVNEKLHLRPANRHYTEEAYKVDDSDCYLIGRVLSIIRRF